MGNRNLRVNQLLQREVSEYVHRHLQSQAVGVTITEVDTANDYKSATVFFSLVAADVQGAPAVEEMLNENAQAINQHLRRVITLRNIPRLRFQYDPSMERGSRILSVLDEIEAEQKRRST